MKKILFFLPLLLLLAVPVLAQETENDISLDETVEASDLDTEEPNILPGSKWYFLKEWQRSLRSVFAFGKAKKAELKLVFSSEKLLEARKLAEKLGNPELIERALAKYQEEMEKMKETAERIKGEDKINRFLDKFTKHQILHQKILEKLETQVPSKVLEKIQQTREKHEERFSEVMQKLEDKEQIKSRMENALQNIKGSSFKDIKNLEIIETLTEDLPNDLKRKIQELKETKMQELKQRVENMGEATKQRLNNYLGEVKGNVESFRFNLQNQGENTQNQNQNACTANWDPICGQDNETYSNECVMEQAGAKQQHKGVCQESIQLNQGDNNSNDGNPPTRDTQ